MFSVFSLLSSTLVEAMSATPIVLEMQDSGGKSKSVLRVSNDTASPVPVEVKVFRLDLDEIGNSTTTAADRDFLIFPPVATIPPGGSQAFRVQWAGSSRLDKSQAYIFSINQLPVKFPTSQSGMQVLISFSVITNVDPVAGRATLDLVSTGIGRDQAGVAQPQLTVQNNGNKHASLANASIAFTSGTWTKTVSAATLRQMLGVALIQPGKRRKFTIPIVLPPSATTLSARIDYQPVTTSSVSK